MAIIWQFWNIIERWISTSLGTSVESFATNNIWFIVYHASESIRFEWKEKFNRCSPSPILKSVFYVNGAPIVFWANKERIRNLLWIFLENLAHLCNSWLKVDNGLCDGFKRFFFFVRFQSRPWNSTTFFCANQITLATRINDRIQKAWLRFQCPWQSCVHSNTTTVTARQELLVFQTITSLRNTIPMCVYIDATVET